MDEILLLLQEARKKKSSLWNVLGKIEKDRAKKMVEILSGFVEKSREYRGGAVLYEFVKEYYYPLLLKEESVENERKILNISAFFDRIKQFESRSDQQDIVYLIDFLDLVIEAGENPATAESELDVEAVKVMTVHGAKGLEFPVVFLPALVSQRFPSMNRSETIPFPDGLKKDLSEAAKTNIAEERRLFYVACTRARENLYLTASRYYGDAKRPKKVSQFVSELGINIEKLEEVEEKEKLITEQISKPDLETKKWEMPKRLSYSQISSFKDCPRKYQYSYIYKIPGEGSPALSFGISMHNTMKRFYDYLEASEVPNLFGEKGDDLTMLFSIYNESFIYADYLSRKHQKQAYEAGKKMLGEYFQKNGPKFKLPYLTEKSFVVPLGDYVFSGRFDRVDKLDDGSVEVIDYKTGKTRAQKDADKDLQLSLYALACRDALNLNPSKLSFYFLGDNEKIESVRTEEQMDKAKKEFIGIADQMKETDFIPTPGKFVCQYCPYRNICDSATT
jgi:DNA helicase-2/ATP-dependent DNA helicase PcrA